LVGTGGAEKNSGRLKVKNKIKGRGDSKLVTVQILEGEKWVLGTGSQVPSR